MSDRYDLVIIGSVFKYAHHADREIILDTPPVRTRFLVGADGARSIVARCYGLEDNRQILMLSPRRFAMGSRLAR